MAGYCGWTTASELDRAYHDTEWGIPVREDRTLFEFLMLEVLQCGLSWELMLRKREIFRRCFDGFEVDRVARYTEADVARILETEGMLRSPRKVRAIIQNAACFQTIREEFGSFSAYLWGFSGGKTIVYAGHSGGWIPVSNGLSEKISRDLKRRGFKYLGPITVYSYLQACGVINDHEETCPRYALIMASYPTVVKRRYKEKR